MGRMGQIGCVVIALAGGVMATTSVFGAMGGAAMMERLHPKEKGKLTMDEARAAAAHNYDVIFKANGGKVSILQLGGRVTADDLKAANIGDGEADETVSKADYLALASRFFAEANVSRKPDVSPADGTLSVDELSTPAGEKLLRLLE